VGTSTGAKTETQITTVQLVISSTLYAQDGDQLDSMDYNKAILAAKITLGYNDKE